MAKAKTKAKPKADQPKKRGFFRGVANIFFDVPRWVNAKQYVETNKTLYNNIKNVFRIAKAEREETFEAAMLRMNITEKELQARVAANQRGIIILLSFIAALCLYGFFLIFKGAVAGTFVVLAVIALSAVRAFQYSFWNFQIKNRKLGCSFKEWLSR